MTLLTSVEAGKLVGKSPVTIRAWVHRGYLKAVPNRSSALPLYEDVDVLVCERSRRKTGGHRPASAPIVELTGSSPEPAIGSVVRDAYGRLWHRSVFDYDGAANWENASNADDDPESWIKVAGDYGPVVLEQQ